MPVTLKTIAAETKLSVGAVSRILNNKEGEARISEKSAELVRETARRLGYVGNPAARNLRLRRSDMIGLILDMPETNNDLYFRLFRGISAASSAHEKTLLFSDIHGKDSVIPSIEKLLARHAEGIITVLRHNPEEVGAAQL